MKFVFTLLSALALVGCKEEIASAPPPPMDLSQDALSFFCQMTVSEHGGPKGQVHLDGYPAPLFFAQVRDMVAYLKSPERDAEIMAVYVSDMGVAASWEKPGVSNWTDASEATFVVEANVRGGMGAAEIVPFAKMSDAQAFALRWGGRPVNLNDIPDHAAIGAVDTLLILETPS